jgi:hypothetical protein
MTTDAPVQAESEPITGGWIARLAADERKRDDVRLRATEAATRKDDFVRVHGQRLLDELRTSVLRDIETFRAEFPGDAAREIVFETAPADGGFLVRKPAYPTVALSVAPHLSSAAVTCEYRFTPTNGLPPRLDRHEFMFTRAADGAVQLKHHGTGEAYSNADALSEYLLVPVFTGRPR